MASQNGSVVVGFCGCVVYIGLSAGLISFNKYLMGAEYFPFATALTTLHMTVSLTCGALLYCVAPGLFPSMAETQGNRTQILKYFAPLALLFAVGVVLSNQAYMYCSVAFLQIMKQGNVSIVFGLSCLAGSQVCDRLKLLLVVWVVCGAGLGVTGEIHFVWLGFIVQLLSQICESCKSVLQEWILRGSDVKLDPLTYNLFMAPCCLVVLAVGNVLAYDPLIPERFLAHWHLLLPNAFVAFMLNVVIALVIKHASAMGFMMAGVTKDMVIVVSSAYVFREALAPQQILGFSIATVSIGLWSLLKISPDSSVMVALSRLVGESVQEKLPIAKPAK